MTDTVSLPEFVTYTRVSSGLTATPKGRRPTGTVVTTWFVAASTMDTSLENEFGTYANGAASAGAATSVSESVRSAATRAIIGGTPSMDTWLAVVMRQPRLGL